MARRAWTVVYAPLSATDCKGGVPFCHVSCYSHHRTMKPSNRILVTGAHGMLGRNTVEVLHAAGYTSLLTPSSTELDLRDAAAVKTYFNEHKPEYVFHLAARVGGIKANMAHQADFLRDNLQLDSAVMDAAHAYGVTKFISMASSCMYPRLCPQPMNEDMLLTGPFEPTNEGYAIAKIASVKLCQYYRAQYGMNAFSLVAPNMYGRYEKFDLEHSHVLSAFIMRFHQAKEEGAKEVTMWGTGSPRREFLYAHDMAQALLLAMLQWDAADLEHAYMNVGTGADVSIKELAEIIRACVGYEGNLVWDTTKPDGMPRKLMDSTRAAARGWSAPTFLEKGIQEMYDHYRSTL